MNDSCINGNNDACITANDIVENLGHDILVEESNGDDVVATKNYNTVSLDVENCWEEIQNETE